MNVLLLITGLLLMHWIGDFLLQTDRVSLNKSTNNRVLFEHSFIYANMTICPVILFFTFTDNSIPYLMEFIIYLLLLASHFCIDYCTSRGYQRVWDRYGRHYFFVLMGFDQFVHSLCLLAITYLVTR